MQATHGSKPPFIDNSLHLFGLAVIEVAQPLLDLFWRQPEFFVVRGSKPLDIILLVLLLSLVIPISLICFELVLLAVSRTL